MLNTLSKATIFSEILFSNLYLFKYQKYIIQINGHRVPSEIALMMRLNQRPHFEIQKSNLLQFSPDNNHVIKLIEWFQFAHKWVLILERPQRCTDLFDYITTYQCLDEDKARLFFWQVNI